MQPSANGWYYQAKQGFAKGMFYCSSFAGASSSTYHKDGIYLLGNSAGGAYEVVSFGDLYRGVAGGGLSCVNCYYGVSYAYWSISARLSPSGNRGELAA